MNWLTGVVLYVLIWWTVLFAVFALRHAAGRAGG